MTSRPCRTRRLTVGLLALVLFLPAAAAAQPPGPPTFLAELHVGSLWPQPLRIAEAGDTAAGDVRPAVGGRVGGYFGGEAFDRRVSLMVHLAWAPLGSAEFFDDDLGSFARLEGHWFALSPTFTVDLVRTSAFTIDVHAGPSLVVETTHFLLEQRFDPDEASGGSDFENVCHLLAFEDRCDEDYRGSAAVGFSLRGVLVPRWRLHAGLSYTWFSYGRHTVAGTVGRTW